MEIFVRVFGIIIIAGGVFCFLRCITNLHGKSGMYNSFASVCLILIGVSFMLGSYEEYVEWGVLGLFGFSFLGYRLLVKVGKAEKEEQALKKEQEALAIKKKEIEAQNALIASLENDTFEFPVHQFYQECQESGIYSFRDNFSKQKAKIIMDSLLDEKKVPASYREKFHSQTKELYKAGKAIEDEQLRLKKLEQRKPRLGKLTEKEKKIQDFNRNYSGYSGLNKSRKIIQDQIAQIDKRIKELEDGQKAAEELSRMMGMSVATEKPRDWAIAGGMASAIGGTGAGVAAALDAMKENEKIEARNQANRKAVAQTMSSFSTASNKAANEIQIKEMEKRDLERKLAAIDRKVVMNDVSCDALWKEMRIVKQSVRSFTENTGVYFTLDNNYSPQTPAGVSMAVDGYFQISIYCDDDILIDTIDVSLPLYGLKCKSQMELVGYSSRYMEGYHKNYRMEIKSQNLWLVEM